MTTTPSGTPVDGPARGLDAPQGDRQSESAPGDPGAARGAETGAEGLGAERAALSRGVVRAIHALKTPPPPGSGHYRSGWDDGLEAAIDAARDAVLAVLPAPGEAREATWVPVSRPRSAEASPRRPEALAGAERRQRYATAIFDASAASAGDLAYADAAMAVSDEEQAGLRAELSFARKSEATDTERLSHLEGENARLRADNARLEKLLATTCPGYEATPNPCRCGCEGCKHHCSAHQSAATPEGDEAQQAGADGVCWDGVACALAECAHGCRRAADLLVAERTDDDERRERYAEAIYAAGPMDANGPETIADAAMDVADAEQQKHIEATSYWFEAASERREEITRLRDYAADLELKIINLGGYQAASEDLRVELDDWRRNLAQRSFTAPDADLDTILASLDARIRDAVADREAARGTAVELECQLAAVADLHREGPASLDGPLCTNGCGTWPCNTARTLNDGAATDDDETGQ